MIPDSVTEIGEAAFLGCSGMTGLTLGKSVTEIGATAFAFCSDLTGIVIIPDGVHTIQIGLFGGCENLSGAIIGNGVANTLIDNNLFKFWNLHGAGITKLFFQSRNHLLVVLTF